jgi:RNA polymerase sigma factor (sigma-70 family)
MKSSMVLSTDYQLYREQAVGNAFKQEKKRLLEFIKKRVSNTADAEDILQDVFYHFVESFNIVSPIEHVTAWLFRVARNKIIDRYRKHKPLLIDNLPAQQQTDNDPAYTVIDLLYEPGDNPENMYLREVIWEEFAICLEKLPPEQKQVFVLHELEGKSFKEIAEQTGISVNTLLSRKRYAVLFLRKHLERTYQDIVKNIPN